MILQTADLSRYVLVFITQAFIAGVFIFLSYQVLKRHKTRISIICSGMFIPIAAAFIVNIIYLPLRSNPTVHNLHIFSIFLLFLGQTFILMFNLNLLKSKFELTVNKQILIFTLYSIISFVLFLIPGGLIINDTTDWRPLYSIILFICLVIYTTVCLAIPSLFFSFKIYSTFEDQAVKNKWRYYLIGYIGLLYSFYSLLFYNTYAEPFLKTILGIVSGLVLVISGILIYLGIGRQLQK